MNRTGSCIFLWLLLAGCQTNRSSLSEPLDAGTLREREVEYSVYSHLIRGYHNEPSIRIGDSTFMHDGRDPFCDVAGRPKPKSCRDQREGTAPEMWEDYAKKNQKRWLLLPLFDKDIVAVLERNAKFVEPACDGPTTISFSKAGFNRELTQVIVHVRSVTGKGPMPGCGVFSEHGVVLEKTAAGWRILRGLGGVIS